MENEPTQDPTAKEIARENANLEPKKLPAKVLLDRKCYKCGKKSKFTLHQARLAKSGRLVSRCCEAGFVPIDRKDMKQLGVVQKKIKARRAALPVTEKMVRTLFQKLGHGFGKTRPRTLDCGLKMPAGWEVLDSTTYPLIVFKKDFTSLGEAYVYARKLSGLPTDIEVIEGELGVTPAAGRAK